METGEHEHELITKAQDEWYKTVKIIEGLARQQKVLAAKRSKIQAELKRAGTWTEALKNEQAILA